MDENVITLRRAAQLLAERGIKIRWTNGLSLLDFFEYYDKHSADGSDMEFFEADIKAIFG